MEISPEQKKVRAATNDRVFFGLESTVKEGLHASVIYLGLFSEDVHVINNLKYYSK